MKISKEIIDAIVAERREHDGPLKLFVERWAETLSVTPQTIYRRLKNCGAGSGRKRRGGKSIITDEQVELAGAMIYASRRKNNKVMMPTCVAVEILEHNEKAPKGVSLSTWNRRLRETKMTAAEIKKQKSYRPILTEYPNEMGQVDATPCTLYFLDDKTGEIKERDNFVLEVSRKPEDFKKISKHLVRYAYVDHFSGSFYFQYFYAAGENSNDVTNFLYNAFAPKEDGLYPMEGVPFYLMLDKGSAMKCAATKNLFENLDIEVIYHQAGNPRAKGLVEGFNSFLDKHFESRFCLQIPKNLIQLNEWAFDFCVEKNFGALYRGFDTRTNLWLKIKEEQLRRCPPKEIYGRCIATEPVRRVVTADLWINFNGNKYRLPDNPAYNGAEAMVRMNAWDVGKAEVVLFANTDREIKFSISPVGQMENGRRIDPANAQKVGEPRAIRDSATDKGKKKAEEALGKLGVKWTGTGQHRRGKPDKKHTGEKLTAFGYHRDGLPDVVVTIPKKGTDLPIATEAKKETIHRHIDVIEEITEELGRGLFPSENDFIYKTYPQGMTDSEIDKTLALFKKQDDDDNVIAFSSSG